MDLVLIKDGTHEANIFHDVLDLVGESAVEGSSELIASRARMDLKMRLVQNTSTIDTNMHLALTHYSINMGASEFADDSVKGIDLTQMKAALDEGHDFVLLAATTDNSHMIPEFALLPAAIYIVRDSFGHLINYTTKERLIPNDALFEAGGSALYADVVVFVAMVKPTKFPMYYLTANQHCVGIEDGLDAINLDDDTIYRKISPQDGSIRNSIMAPMVDGVDCKLINDSHIFAKSTFAIGFFQSDRDVIGMFREHLNLSELSMTVDTNLEYRALDTHKFAFTPPAEGSLGYIRLSLDVTSPIFDEIDKSELLTYEYIVSQ